MNDSEVFEKVDSILQENLTHLTIKDNYKLLLQIINEKKGEFKNNFPGALGKGGVGELCIRQYLESLGHTFMSKNDTIEYDLKMLYKGKEYTYEIKTESRHIKKDGKDTGNLAIEYECRGKASGIDATKADFFVTFLPLIHEVWRVRTNTLRDFINENKDNEELIGFPDYKKTGDDNSDTKIYLLRRFNPIVRSLFTVSNIKNVLL